MVTAEPYDNDRVRFAFMALHKRLKFDKVEANWDHRLKNWWINAWIDLKASQYVVFLSKSDWGLNPAMDQLVFLKVLPYGERE